MRASNKTASYKSHAIPRHPTSSEAKGGKQTRLRPNSMGGWITSRPVPSRPVTGPRSQPGSSPRSPPAHHHVKRTQITQGRKSLSYDVSTSARNNCSSQCMACRQKPNANARRCMPCIAMYHKIQSNAPWYDTRSIMHLQRTRQETESFKGSILNPSQPKSIQVESIQVKLSRVKR